MNSNRQSQRLKFQLCKRTVLLYPGGAGNVAMNLKSLESVTVIFGRGNY